MDLSILIIVLVLSLGNSEDLKDLNITELLKLAEDISTFHFEQPKTNNVQFFLKDKTNEGSRRVFNYTLNSKKSTKFLVHGWLENHRRTWYEKIAQTYLSNNDVNIIEVDWERLARLPYTESAKSTKFVGQQLADFIQKTHLNPKDVHIIGLSLGGHVAGFAGKAMKEMKQQISRITGLDPAGPYFRSYLLEPTERLSKTDAEIVDVIHTDGGFYGYESALGTVDIYVNGGKRIQPGCLQLGASPMTVGDIVENTFCSHAKSTHYFIEWIGGKTFSCRFSCQLSDNCSAADAEIIINYEEIDNSITGVCFAEYLASSK